MEINCIITHSWSKCLNAVPNTCVDGLRWHWSNFFDKRTPFLITYLLGVVCVCLNQTSQSFLYQEFSNNAIHNFPHLLPSVGFALLYFANKDGLCWFSNLSCSSANRSLVLNQGGSGGWVCRGGLTMVNWLKWQSDKFVQLTFNLIASLLSFTLGNYNQTQGEFSCMI